MAAPAAKAKAPAPAPAGPVGWGTVTEAFNRVVNPNVFGAVRMPAMAQPVGRPVMAGNLPVSCDVINGFLTQQQRCSFAASTMQRNYSPPGTISLSCMAFTLGAFNVNQCSILGLAFLLHPVFEGSVENYPMQADTILSGLPRIDTNIYLELVEFINGTK